MKFCRNSRNFANSPNAIVFNLPDAFSWFQPLLAMAEDPEKMMPTKFTSFQTFTESLMSTYGDPNLCTHGHKPQSTTPAQSSTPLLPSNNRSIHVLQIPRRKLLEEYSNPVPILNPILSPSLALNPNPAPNPTLTPNPSPRPLERPLKYPSLDQRPSPLLSSNLGHNSISCHSPKLPKLPNSHPQMFKNQPTQISA